MSDEINKITDLPGVGAATAEKLESSGYSDLMSIAVASPGELIESSGVTEANARKIIKAARDALHMGFETGDSLLERRKRVAKISTGSNAFDQLLDGGFETGVISEVFSEYGCGKCIEKKTKVLYFNDDTAHLQSIEDVYEKYKKMNGEREHDDGMIVDIPTVKVLGLTKEGVKRTKASFIFKQYVKKLFEIKTRRGRTMRITGPHKLLSFNNGLEWKPSAVMSEGDLIAYPTKLEFPTVSDLTSDDAYFLGFFCAEGTPNPFSISTGSKEAKDWICNYIIYRHGYEPRVREDNRREKPVYTILFRQKTKEFLAELANCKAGGKFVPESVLSSDSGITEHFLGGYIDGDGCIREFDLSMTTKSSELAEGLSYLFLKLGVPVTSREKMIKGNKYHQLSICGEERVNLNGIGCRIKNINYKSKNSSYGYSRPVIEFLQRAYKDTIGGCRGNKQKFVGRNKNEKDIFYHYLTRTKLLERNMNKKTFQKVRDIFFDGFKEVLQAIELNERIENLTEQEYKKLIDLLPFSFNSISSELGITKAGVGNYVERGIPVNRIGRIKEILGKRLNQIKERLEFTLKTLKNINHLNFDEIVSINEVNYNDFVYDFVVPEGHSFVGGAVPTIMHNTQVGHILCVNLIKMNPEAHAIYIDTENTFRPERILQLCEGAGIDGEDALKRIHIARAYNSDHQMLLAEKAEELIKKQGFAVKLVVVDSLTAHFRAEFIGRGTLAERQQKLNRHMHTLAKLADAHNLCVFVTNQVMSRPDVFFGDPTAAIGGHVVAHASAFRIYLRKGRKGSRVAKLVDSPNLPDGEAAFIVKTEGLEDI